MIKLNYFKTLIVNEDNPVDILWQKTLAAVDFEILQALIVFYDLEFSCFIFNA